MCRALLLILAMLNFAAPVQAGLWNNIKGMFGSRERCQPPSIRVLVAHDLEKADMEVKGAYSLYDPYSNCYISTRFIGKSRTILPMGDGLKWGEAFPGLYQLRVAPEDCCGLVNVDGVDYLGSVTVYDIGGTISIVNQVTAEDYIRSILGREELQGLHPETLAAIAITARTNAYFQAVNPKNTYWAVDAKKVGYVGSRSEPLATDKAVAVTRYMIMSQSSLYDEVATPFAARFSSDTSASKEERVSQISIEEAEKMAQRGDHAAQILAKAFPGTTIMLINY